MTQSARSWRSQKILLHVLVQLWAAEGQAEQEHAVGLRIFGVLQLVFYCIVGAADAAAKGKQKMDYARECDASVSGVVGNAAIDASNSLA